MIEGGLVAAPASGGEERAACGREQHDLSGVEQRLVPRFPARNVRQHGARAHQQQGDARLEEDDGGNQDRGVKVELGLGGDVEREKLCQHRRHGECDRENETLRCERGNVAQRDESRGQRRQDDRDEVARGCGPQWLHLRDLVADGSMTWLWPPSGTSTPCRDSRSAHHRDF